MKIMRTLVGVGTALVTCDTIEYEGKLWLVPKWLENPATGERAPVRIVRMDSLKHQKTTFGGHDFLLNVPVPKPVLDGVRTFEAGVQYEVVESPPFQIPPANRGLH